LLAIPRRDEVLARYLCKMRHKLSAKKEKEKKRKEKVKMTPEKVLLA
jgi:hypothetical protein